ncbi:MAG: dihydropteroate synthase [Ferrovum sp.]|nr:dihydropteroate synthase [Ferrovum sp.]NDU87334.1 dihydropteroate synthase [Ferrovum sp.]
MRCVAVSAERSSLAVRCGGFLLNLAQPQLMGIVNVTPDSFSDGGQYVSASAAIDHGLALAAAGADILDVGGESTRPGAPPVSLGEELQRVIPVVEALARESGLPISIDTRHVPVMRAAVAAGATLINDIQALQAPGAVEFCRDSQVGICLMHMQGQPATMQQAPHYPRGVVEEVRDFLVGRAQQLERAGIERERLILDPGFGFGKTRAHNLALLRGLGALVETGYPLLVGLSRKSMTVPSGSGVPPHERLGASLAGACWAVHAGAHFVRTHDVTATRQALAFWRDVTTMEDA